ncbi:MAG: FG-GAP-like repeat-containing protein, partial [Planctomycetota bacterium]
MNPKHPTSFAAALLAVALLTETEHARAQEISFAPDTALSINDVPVILDSDVADVTGDGVPDVLFLGALNAGAGPRRLFVAVGLGARTFAPLERISAVDTARDLPVVADLDLDGDLDLALLDQSGELVAVVNDGSGVFTAISATAGSTAGPFDKVRALADADADGDLDAFVVRATGEILIGTFDGTTESFDVAPTGLTARLETAVDLNGDGRAELVTADAGIELLAAGPAGGYGAPVSISTSVIVPQGRIDVVVDDLDGDGFLDLLPAGAGTGQDFVFLGDGALGFTPTALFPSGLPDPPSGLQRYVHGDTDGVLDLLYLARVGGDIFFQSTFATRGIGSLPFPGGVSPPFPPFGTLSQGAAFQPQDDFQDVDGDGATDLLIGAFVAYGPFLAAPLG